MRSRASGVARPESVNKKKVYDKGLQGAISKRSFPDVQRRSRGSATLPRHTKDATQGKSWSVRLQGVPPSEGKSWSFRLQGCRRRKRYLRVFGDSPSGKEGYQNNCENGGYHAEAKDYKFARAATEVPRGKGVQPGFSLTTELAKQQRTWQSPQHRRDQIWSKTNRGQTIEIIC